MRVNVKDDAWKGELAKRMGGGGNVQSPPPLLLAQAYTKIIDVAQTNKNYKQGRPPNNLQRFVCSRTLLTERKFVEFRRQQ